MSVDKSAMVLVVGSATRSAMGCFGGCNKTERETVEQVKEARPVETKVTAGIEEKSEKTSAMPLSSAVKPITEYIANSGAFNGASGICVDSSISLNAKGKNDPGFSMQLTQQLEGKKLAFSYTGSASGGFREGKFTVICLGGTNERNLKEGSFKPSDAPQTAEIIIPDGTTKINVILVGEGDVDVKLSDVQILGSDEKPETAPKPETASKPGKEATVLVSDTTEKVKESWIAFKTDMISGEGIPMMRKGEKWATSESVSYALLQSSLLEDWSTFDKVLGWAEKNMQRSDGLFGWEWKDGKFTQYGMDSATDGDEDIAAALIIASKKTGNDGYADKARKTLEAIWENDVVKLDNGKLLLTAGDKQSLYLKDEQGNKAYGVAPSYFRPTYYAKLFKDFDPAHPWEKLLQTSYEYIEKAADSKMHGKTAEEVVGTKNLPPDMIAVRPDGSITDHEWSPEKDYCFAGDAPRTLYWMALQNLADPGDRFALRYMKEQTGSVNDAGPLAFIKTQVQSKGLFEAGYQINGDSIGWGERLFSYSCAYAYLKQAGEKDSAQKVMDLINKKFPYENGTWTEQRQDFYYGTTWMRFALLLDSLAKEMK